MDPLSALSIAAAVVQFVDFASELVGSALEIRSSVSGATQQNESLAFVTAEMQAISIKLSRSTPTWQLREDEKAVADLALECQTISKELLALLEKTSARNPRSLRESAKAALKNAWNEKEKQELKQRLDTCRAQLHLHMSSLYGSDIKSRLDKLVKSALSDAVELASIQKKMDLLRNDLTVNSLGPEARKQLEALLDLPAHVSLIVTQHRILRALAFDVMYGRFDRVEEAHHKTFDWILQESSSDSSPKAMFREWLASGNGIFHISGKPGSGKSTLMKYLCEHSRTRELLESWAKDRELVFAKFFFWRAGEELQKSLSGLLRTLLHDSLEQCPDLIQSVFPELWEEVESLPWQAPVTRQLSNKEIRAAFHRLIESPNLYMNHSYCFFIDGLDEYQETRQEDYEDMVRILLSWTKVAPCDVKLCVSSRELNVFQDMFSPDKRIRLQELTQSDIDLMVRENLADHPRFLALDETEFTRQSLMTEIIQKADGVFLWVALVLKTLREGLQNGDSLSDLRHKLDSIPPELEQLFQYLLDSIHPSDRKKSAQTFNILWTISQCEKVEFGSLCYSYLDDFNNNPEFAFALGLHMDEEEVSNRRQKARRQLYGRCKGLAEFRKSDINTNYSYGFPHSPRYAVPRRSVSDSDGSVDSVAYANLSGDRVSDEDHFVDGVPSDIICDDTLTVIHRSVHEFLHEPEVQAKFISNLGNRVEAEAISQCSYASIKFLVEFIKSSKYRKVNWRADFSISARIRLMMQSICIQGNPSQSGMRILDEIDESVNHFRCSHYSRSKYDYDVMDIIGWNCHSCRLFFPSVLQTAAWAGIREYVFHKIENDSTTSEDPSIIGHIFNIANLCTVKGFPTKPFSHAPGGDKVIEALLERGFSPQTVSATYVHRDMTVEGTTGSVWHHFLFMTLYGALVNNHRRQARGIVEAYLRYGADPRFWILLEPSPGYQERPTTSDYQYSSTDNLNLVNDNIEVQDSSENAAEQNMPISALAISSPKQADSGSTTPDLQTMDITYKIRFQFYFNNIRYTSKWCSSNIDHQLAHFIRSKGRRISLSDAIEYLQPENTRVLLQLIDRNLKQMEHSENTNVDTGSSKDAIGETDGGGGSGIMHRGDVETAPIQMKLAYGLNQASTWAYTILKIPAIPFVFGILFTLTLPRLRVGIVKAWLWVTNK